MIEELVNILEIEKKLEEKKLFLRSYLKDRLQANLPEGIADHDYMSVKELLIKKLLEYKEVRNYAEVERKEEESKLVNHMQCCNESKDKLSYLINTIKKKLSLMLQSCSSGSNEYYKKLEELIDCFISILNKLCKLISNQTKENIKILKIEREKNRKYNWTQECDVPTYNNLVSKKRKLEVRYSSIKEKIKERNEKLDDTIATLEKIKVFNKEGLRNTIKKFSIKVELKRENVKKAAETVKELKNILEKTKKEFLSVEKQVGLHSHRELLLDCEMIRQKTPDIQRLLLKSSALYSESISPKPKRMT